MALMLRFYTLFILALATPVLAFAETVGVFFDSKEAQIKFAAIDVKTALESKGFTVEMLSLSSLKSGYGNKKVVIALASNSGVSKLLTGEGGKMPSGLGEQAYSLRTTKKEQAAFWVFGGDVNGAMYGAFQIAENISADGFTGTYNNQETPFMLNRGMKLNLPLDKRVPTYVGGWSSNSAKKAIPHVWDMDFWKKLIDQQARNRYNVLSIWVHHPFPALVKLADYPKVSLPRIEGFDGFVKELNHEQRVAFWREVMQYAHDRGMKFYFFNWNIHLEHADTQYPELKKDPTSLPTIDYMYKSMQSLIKTYPELDGFGITSGDGMHGTHQENTAWTWKAMGKAVNDYLRENPSRKFNLIHRGIKTNPEVWDSTYAPLKSVPNLVSNYSVKYAQAHAYSTTTPKWTNGIQAIAKLNMKTWVTVRNDDFFYLNWGDPKFIREFLTNIPKKEAVVGIYIGTDGYNPSRTYFCKDESQNGQLEVERRWYMEMLWARIAYNPQISDDVFKNQLAKRFPTISANNLFEAWTLASRPLPKVTEMIMGTWSLDFHWYPEACWSDPKRCTGFRTIDGFANETTVAKGSEWCDIATTAAGTCGNKKTAYMVADDIQADAEKAWTLINTMKNNGNKDLDIAIKNVKQQAALSMYYAYKIRGATFKKAGQTEKARDCMSNAYCWWVTYSRTMEETYHTDSFRNLSITPNWKFADENVLKEYTDLGGTGIPSCK